MLTAEHRAELESYIKELLMREWVDQGHFMDGRVVNEMELKISETVSGFEAAGMMFPYASYMEYGVEASRIPFSGRSGRGGKSRYIEALTSYVQRRMAITDLKEAKSVAFAIAHTHKKEGMPSLRSKEYSKTGKRTGWVTETLANNADQLGSFIEKLMGDVLIRSITATIEGHRADITHPIKIRL